jgi:hypothetical protein
VVSGCCMTKRPFYENIWNRKRFSSILTDLALSHFAISEAQKTPCWKKISNAKKISVWLFFQCLNSIPRKDYEIGLKG